jgi:hypothetical protein
MFQQTSLLKKFIAYFQLVKKTKAENMQLITLQCIFENTVYFSLLELFTLFFQKREGIVLKKVGLCQYLTEYTFEKSTCLNKYALHCGTLKRNMGILQF